VHLPRWQSSRWRWAAGGTAHPRRPYEIVSAASGNFRDLASEVPVKFSTFGDEMRGMAYE